MTTSFQPVSSDERLRTLDVLRGAALLGIALMNIVFSRPAVCRLRESEPVGRQRSAQRRRAGGAVGAVRRQDAGAVLDDVRRRHRARSCSVRSSGRTACAPPICSRGGCCG